MPTEYLKNSDFEEMIKQYRKLEKVKKKKPKEFEEAKLKLANAFSLLANRLITGYKFQHIDSADAAQEAYVIGMEKLHHFKPTKGKAFSFFTQIILNHFKQLYRSAKAHNELKIKFAEHLKSKDKNMNSRNSRNKQRFQFKNDLDYQEYNPQEEY